MLWMNDDNKVTNIEDKDCRDWKVGLNLKYFLNNGFICD